jgi:hypothetical protein
MKKPQRLITIFCFLGCACYIVTYILLVARLITGNIDIDLIAWAFSGIALIFSLPYFVWVFRHKQ